MGKRPEQPWFIRLAHWVNVPVLALMAGSGLQILTAYPFMGPQGGRYWWWPLQGWNPPALLRAGSWLGGARHLHFAMAWPLVVTGALYMLYVALSGEWRRRLFVPWKDTRNALHWALHYARLRRETPPQGLYNGLQRLGYTSAVALGVVEVLSGLALWKPVQLWPVAALFGGYDGARTVHLLGLLALGGFVVGHVAMVALHPRTLLAMLTGGRRE